jgi:hypothetical protein
MKWDIQFSFINISHKSQINVIEINSQIRPKFMHFKDHQIKAKATKFINAKCSNQLWYASIS